MKIKIGGEQRKTRRKKNMIEFVRAHTYTHFLKIDIGMRKQRKKNSMRPRNRTKCNVKHPRMQNIRFYGISNEWQKD